MNCPNCIEKLSAAGINSYDCLYCKGSWLSGTIIYDLLVKNGNNPSIEQLQNTFEKQNEQNIKRACPECISTDLYVVHVHDVELDFCNKCHGVFFDEGEIEKIFKLKLLKKPDEFYGEGAYVATEGLFWIIAGFLGGL